MTSDDFEVEFEHLPWQFSCLNPGRRRQFVRRVLMIGGGRQSNIISRPWDNHSHLGRHWLDGPSTKGKEQFERLKLSEPGDLVHLKEAVVYEGRKIQKWLLPSRRGPLKSREDL